MSKSKDFLNCGATYAHFMSKFRVGGVLRSAQLKGYYVNTLRKGHFKIALQLRTTFGKVCTLRTQNALRLAAAASAIRRQHDK